MPLPPAPTKRATLLSTEAYEATARPTQKGARKPVVPPEAQTPERPQALDFDTRPGSGGSEAYVESFFDEDEDIVVLEQAPETAAEPEVEPAPAPTPASRRKAAA